MHREELKNGIHKSEQPKQVAAQASQQYMPRREAGTKLHQSKENEYQTAGQRGIPSSI